MSSGRTIRETFKTQLIDIKNQINQIIDADLKGKFLEVHQNLERRIGHITDHNNDSTYLFLNEHIPVLHKKVGLQLEIEKITKEHSSIIQPNEKLLGWVNSIKKHLATKRFNEEETNELLQKLQLNIQRIKNQESLKQRESSVYNTPTAKQSSFNIFACLFSSCMESPEEADERRPLLAPGSTNIN